MIRIRDIMILIVMFARYIDYELTSFAANSLLLLAIHNGKTLITLFQSMDFLKCEWNLNFIVKCVGIFWYKNLKSKDERKKHG